MDWLTNESESTQGSPKWHSFRGKGIGSSDSAAIMGVSPWKDIYTLWLEKTDQLPEHKKFKGNFFTQRGSDLEMIARDMYEREIGAKFPDAIGTHPIYDFIRCSYDGINHDLKSVLEIKCPGAKAHAEAIAGRVPDYYYPQCQHLLLVSGYDNLDYVSWDGESDELVIVHVKADTEYQNKLIDKYIWFWQCVTNMVPPRTETTSKELLTILTKRDSLKPIIDEITKQYNELTDQIRELVTEDTQCGEFKIKFTDVKGQVDLSLIPGIDFELYRKPSTRRLNITKDKE